MLAGIEFMVQHHAAFPAGFTFCLLTSSTASPSSPQDR